jgi:integrase
MLRDGLSPATVNLVLSVLSSAYKRAVKWRLAQHNVIRDVDAPRIESKEVEFTLQEVRALLSAASGDRLNAAYSLALSTGMRGGEILALQKPDIDLARGTLRVRRTLILNESMCRTSSIEDSRRTLQLPNTALDALAKHMQKNGTGIWLFPGRTGQNLRHHNFIKFQWKPLVRYCQKLWIGLRSRGNLLLATSFYQLSVLKIRPQPSPTPPGERRLASSISPQQPPSACRSSLTLPAASPLPSLCRYVP